MGLRRSGNATNGANGEQEMSMNEDIFARIWPLSERIMNAIQERKGMSLTSLTGKRENEKWCEKKRTRRERQFLFLLDATEIL